MDEINHKYSVIGWGALFVWWGMVFLIDPLTLGEGAIGSGLILFGVNAARLAAGIHDSPTRRSNFFMGTILILWGLLEFVRQTLGWGWGASFAFFLIDFGAVSMAALLFPAPEANPAH